MRSIWCTSVTIDEVTARTLVWTWTDESDDDSSAGALVSIVGARQVAATRDGPIADRVFRSRFPGKIASTTIVKSKFTNLDLMPAFGCGKAATTEALGRRNRQMNRDDFDSNFPSNVIRLDDRTVRRGGVRLTPPAVESEERRRQRILKAEYMTLFVQFLTVLPDAELRDRAEAILGLLPSDHKDRRGAVSVLFTQWKCDFDRCLEEKQNKPV
jgi:hypothetical protein